ncbi:caspase family protein, partial [Leptolyngbya sp. FACHB-36]|uniref:caspase family protein n=1 Tax=Leptolyngbya sp. FACHB-36 TaxID=2692808 RepID=UPI0016812889
MKRRSFLQRTGLALAAWSVSDIALSASRYHRVLADPTPRKLALLVGINQYRTVPLSGCITDVALQRELLIHRFGFQPSDVLTLTDQQATREAIVDAFLNHLVQQAKSDDVVVFHFSGYGGQVALGATPDAVQPSLVTIEDPGTEGLVVEDLLEDTLLLLLRSLPTNKVTTVLDTSYAYAGKSLQGALRIRARPTLPMQPSAAELDLQAELMERTQSDRDRLAVQRRSGQLPGIVLSAAGVDQLATEARWNGFTAGLFTYALTQQLWQATPATVLRVSLSRVREQVASLVNLEQSPQLSGQGSRERPLKPLHVTPNLGAAAGAVIDIEDDKTVRLWLGGLPPAVLERLDANSVLSLVDDADRVLTLTSRDGLTAKAKLAAGAEDPSIVQVGQLVRERVRVLPRNVGLTVALDSSLERIERVDAISALSNVPRVTATIASEQAADYLFSKQQTTPPTQVASLPDALTELGTPTSTQTSYGLFSLGQATIPNTIGEGGEAVKVAVRRLVPKLQTLLAAKLLSVTANEAASELAVQATLERVDLPQVVLQRATIALGSEASGAETEELASLPIGSRIQYRVENRSPNPVYFLLLEFDSSGTLIALHLPLTRSTETQSAPISIAPDTTLTVPPPSAAFEWMLRGPVGLAEAFLLCSRAPFAQTATALEAVFRTVGDTPALRSLP